jgi:ABC-type transport system involved in multi-copper enzyme maturation permease subunit
MRPYSHELRHQLLTATVVASVVVLALVGVGGGYTSSQVTLGTVQVVYTYSNGYHLLVFVDNSQGTAYGGVRVDLWINASAFNSSNPNPGPAAFLRGQTNGAGWVPFFADVPASGGYYADVVVTSPAGSSSGYSEGLGSGSTGVGQQSAAFLAVSTGLWETTRGVAITALNVTGGVPVGYEVRYRTFSGIYFTGQPAPEANTTLWTTLASYETNVAWNVTVAAPNETWVQFELFAPNGTYAGEWAMPADELLPTGVSPAGSNAVDFLSGVQPLIAILGLMLAYVRYGKDQTLRTYESVLWRPVTRRGLFVIRFGTVLLALAAGLALLLAGLDLWLSASLHAGIPLGALAVLYGVMLAEGAAFAGILVVFSNLLRSRGGVIGVAVGLFLFFSVLFPILVALLGFSVGPGNVSTFFGNSAYANPMELLTPTIAAIVPAAASQSQNLVAPALVSPGFATGTGNPGLVAAVVAAWGVIPAVSGYLLAGVRD